MDVFRFCIFFLHFAVALFLTFGIWFRCDQTKLQSHMYADGLATQVGSQGYWLDSSQFNLSCFSVLPQTHDCARIGLPVYQLPVANAGWHLFGLLGHFEWISSAFALFYTRHPWDHHNWVASATLALAGALLYTPWTSATPFVNELVVFWVNSFVSVGVFWFCRISPPQPEQTSPAGGGGRSGGSSSTTDVHGDFVFFGIFQPQPAALDANFKTSSPGSRKALGPAMRMVEYCITASELYVAVLCIFVVDPPVFMPVLGYTAILVCNLIGVMLHLAVVADANDRTIETLFQRRQYFQSTRSIELGAHGKRVLRYKQLLLGDADEASAPSLPPGVTLPPPFAPGSTAPQPLPPPPPVDDAHEHARAWWVFPYVEYDWGDIGSFLNNGLLDAWTAYGIALIIVLYHASLLTETSAPWYVVASGWLMLGLYTSFGLWVTALYVWPGLAQLVGVCCCIWDGDEFALLERGLDILSLAAKLSIVGSLAVGFVFEGSAC